MFTNEFFPTPPELLDQIGVDCFDKHVIEPSAGSGNIVDWLNQNGAASVSACEIHDKLRQILQGKCKIIQNNFFDVTAFDVSHVQLFLMNPPFSCADRHILHAWEIAPEGCEIVALCNSNSLDNDYSEKRKELKYVIEQYGESLSLGQCFSNAERSTDVDVSLVKLFKPATSSGFDFDGFYFTQESETQANGIMPYNEIRAIVNSYVGAVRCFDEFREVADRMNRFTDITLPDHDAEQPGAVKHHKFGGGFSFHVNYDNNVSNKEDFARAMQMHCWKVVFDKMNIQKWVTSGVLKDINKFIHSRKNYPFTMKNVYRMLEIIIGTKDQTMNKAICEAIDNLTKYTDENRYGLPGWKTNAGHLLNKRFIVDFMVEYWSYSGWQLKHSSNYEKISDLTKALCYITGTHYDEIASVREVFNSKEKQLESNTWYSAGFFEFKFFKKGTMHFKFQNENDWETLNRAYAKAKGQVLPENLNVAA